MSHAFDALRALRMQLKKEARNLRGRAAIDGFAAKKELAEKANHES